MTAKNIVRSLGLAGVLGALLLSAVPVAAENGFTLQLDPIVIGILETDVDTDSAKFSEYRDTSQGFVVPKLHLSGEGSDGNRTLDFSATNIRRDDGRYTLEYAMAGRYEFVIDYNKIPHRFGNNARTIFTETSDGVWEIADPVQSALQTALASQWAISKPSVNYSFL